MIRLLLKVIVAEVAVVILLIALYVQTKKDLQRQQQPRQCVERICKAPMGVYDREKENKAFVSWYDKSVCKRGTYGTLCKTASGETFNDQSLTVAHRSLEFGTRILFRNGDISVYCRVNDRGPFIYNREFDLSYGCASALGIIEAGTARVGYKILR